MGNARDIDSDAALYTTVAGALEKPILRRGHNRLLWRCDDPDPMAAGNDLVWGC